MLLGQVPMADELQEPDYGVEKSLLRLIETRITGGDGGREQTRLLKARALYCPVGQSRPVQALRRRIEQVALTDASVFVTGETGTGKEWVARYLHALSPRHARAFVAVNCAEVPASQMDGELFGRENAARAACLEQAEGGTLFFDEIGALSMPVQARLLQLLKDGSYSRTGSRRRQSCNVRFIAASRRDPGELIRTGRLRKDLSFRLNLVPISLPPLRERREDLPELVTRILERCRRLGQAPVRVQAGALRILGCYDWPGNVRELAALLERLCVLYPGRRIDISELPPGYTDNAPLRESDRRRAVRSGRVPQPEEQALPTEGIAFKTYIENIEIALIRRALTEAGGVITHAARELKIRRTTLTEKMRRYAITADDPA